MLFGTEPVKRAALRLEELHGEINVEWWTRLGEKPAAPGGLRKLSVAGAFPMLRLSEWDEALEKLIDAMRSDVGPNSASATTSRA